MHFHIKYFRFGTHSEKERETKKEYKRAVRQNDARAELTKARFSALVSTSLQPCSLKNNQTILERICKDKAEGKSKKIQGLLAVLHNIQSYLSILRKIVRNMKPVFFPSTTPWRSILLTKTNRCCFLTTTRITSLMLF